MQKYNFINAIIKFPTKRITIPFTRSIYVSLAILSLLTISSQFFSVSDAFAAEEICDSCSYQVSLSGDFTHRKDDTSVAIHGAGDNAAAFREEITGKNFTISISHLPAGRYNIVIGQVETLLSQPGERLFDVTSGDVMLATDFDIVAAAGSEKSLLYHRHGRTR